MSAGIFQVLQHRHHKTDKNLTSEVDILMQSLLQLAFSFGEKRRGAYNCDANKQKTRGGVVSLLFLQVKRRGGRFGSGEGIYITGESTRSAGSMGTVTTLMV